MSNRVRVSTGVAALLLLVTAAGSLAAQAPTPIGLPGSAAPDALQMQTATSTTPVDVAAIQADPVSAGKALAAAAAVDAAAVGELLVSAAMADPRTTADALNAAARTDAGAIGEALASGPAKDPEALAALGEFLPVGPWLPEKRPRAGGDPNSVSHWEEAGSKAAIDLVLVKLTKPAPRADVAITSLPPGILSQFQERTAGTTEQKLGDVTPTSAGSRRSKLPALPVGQVVSGLVRLTPGGYPTLSFITGHVTFFVEKEWLDENGIHPWSIQFSVYDLEQRAWQLSSAKRVREDAERVYFSVVVPNFPNFTTWAVSGSEGPPEAAFRVSDLTIAPVQVREGETVTVEARVTNLSAEQTAPIIAVYLDSLAYSAQRVLLGPDETRAISFEVEPKEGAYEVRVDRLTGKLTVGPAPAATPTPPGGVAPDAGEDDGGAAGIAVVVGLVAVAVVVAAAVLYLRRRARPQGS